MRESPPLLPPARELRAAAGSQPVDPPAASADARPRARQQAGSLQPIQRGIHRSLGEVESALTCAAQLYDHGIPVQRASLECCQQEQVYVALQYLGSQSNASLGFYQVPVNPRRSSSHRRESAHAFELGTCPES